MKEQLGSPQTVRTATVDTVSVEVYSSRQAMGAAAGAAVAGRIRSLCSEQPTVRVAFAAAPSQQEFLEALVAEQGIDWNRVIAFHLDEYIGLPADHAASFGNWLLRHLFSKVRPGQVHFLSGDPADPDAECRRYATLLAQAPLDLACIGVGENGHIAFNDPPVADFADPATVKVVKLEESCRLQQVHDGCFESLDMVPQLALTMTVPAIMSARFIYCMVPGLLKAEAIKNALGGPVTTECPASVLRRHPNTTLYLDSDAASRWR